LLFILSQNKKLTNNLKIKEPKTTPKGGNWLAI